MEYDGWNPHRPGGPLHFSYALLRASDGELLEVLDTAWADWDGGGRLIYTEGGRVHARRIGGNASTLIADFTADTPEQVLPPSWATRWPWEAGGRRKPRRT
jgi:hypothetical protein